MVSDVDLEEQKKDFIKKLEEINKQLETVSLRYGGLNAALLSMSEVTTKAKLGIKDSTEATKIYKRILEERKREEQEILKAQRMGKMTYKEANRELKQLNDRVAEVLPQGLKDQFIYQAKITRLTTAATLAMEAQFTLMKPTLVGLGSVAKIAGNSLKEFIGVYQKNSNDIASATQFSTIAFNTVASTTEATGSALKDTGSAFRTLGAGTSKTSGALRVFGLALEGVGFGISLFGKGLSEVSRSVLPILNAELERVFTSFLQLNASGAVFANGMTGMIDAATRSNLTLDEFSDVVKTNSETLAKTGLGVAGAAQRMADVSTSLRRGGLDKQLYNLGFTYKDQAELVAETMALMRQSGGRLMASDDVVAEQTKKYAENLRIIASITGEDAKKKMAEAQQAANELAFQQKLAAMDETTRAGTIEAMAGMSDIQRKAFMEQVVFGTQITRETAYAVNNIAGLGDSVNAYVQAFNDRTISAQRSLEIQNQFGGIIKNALIQEQDLARAGMANVDVAKSLTDAFGKELAFRNKFSDDATAAAGRNVAAVEEGGGKLQRAMLGAAEAARGLKMEIQNALLGEKGAIYGYADVVAMANKQILEAIQTLKVDIAGVQNKGKTFGEKAGGLTGAVAGGAAGAQVGAGLGAIAGAVFPPAEVVTVPLATFIGGLIGAYYGEEAATAIGGAVGQQLESWWNGLTGNAEGGILSGPKTGYMAKLHGTEAVLPPDLTDMLMMSASTTSPSQVLEAYNNLRAASNDHLDATQDTNELMSTLISKIDQLIDTTKDVVTYTERTAVRVA